MGHIVYSSRSMTHATARQDGACPYAAAVVVVVVVAFKDARVVGLLATERRVDYRSANKGQKPEHPTLTASGAEGPF